MDLETFGWSKVFLLKCMQSSFILGECGLFRNGRTCHWNILATSLSNQVISATIGHYFMRINTRVDGLETGLVLLSN